MTQAIWTAISAFLKSALSVVTVNWQWWTTIPIFTIVCFMYEVITNPEGAINQFMITILSSIFILLPSTPNNWTIGYLLDQLAEQYPAIGWGPVYEIYEGARGIFLLTIVYRIYKFLPFT